MEYFIEWIFNNFSLVLDRLTIDTVGIIGNIFGSYYEGNEHIMTMPFNLSLFSDTPILSTNVWDFLILFFSIFYTVIFVVIVWKIIKKVVVKITRWNKW